MSIFISQAFASEELAHGAGPIYSSPEFWVGVAFILAVLFLIRPISKLLKNFGATRAEKISKKINEASALKDDAQRLLAEYERKFKNADEEASAILERAKQNVERLRQEAEEKMNLSLAKKEAQAVDRVKSAEQNATDEVKNVAINTATKATVLIISEVIAPKNGAKMLEDSVRELPIDLQKIAV